MIQHYLRLGSVMLLLLLLLLVPSSVHAFASYLTSRSGCRTELATEEVIMNAAVVAARESDDPRLYLSVPPTTSVSNSWTVSGDAELGDYEIAVARVPLLARLRIKQVANQETKLKDYQYVIEMDPPGAATFVAADTDTDALTDTAVTNLGQCDDQRRVFGQIGDEHAVQIHSLPVTFWAGWAAQHGAVRLTYRVTFMLSSSETHGESERKQPVADTTAQVAAAQVAAAAARVVDPQKVIDHAASLNRLVQQVQNKQLHDRRNILERKERKSLPSAVAAIKAAQQLSREYDNKVDNTVKDTTEVVDHRPVLTGWPYWIGMLILLLGHVLVIQLCLLYSDSSVSTRKGRRSL